MELLRLKDALKEKGMSGKQLAEAVDVNPNTISRIANNKAFPSGELLQNIARVLQVAVKDLFYPGDDMEELYLKRGEEFVKVGEIKIT